ncbi:MAG TPA: proprotein convertase P-domain-containing protein [Pyrinomonadaceae bacterium]|nr:proprotein convertase P-domain-containing protein [Pyrinomonadaceae bacterium]
MKKADSFRILIFAFFVFFSVIGANAVTYNGSNYGNISDGTGTDTCGTPRNILFNVSGFGGNFGSASVTFTMGPNHPYVGDLRVTLIAPNGTSHLLFSRIGKTTSSVYGDSSNFAGPYTFTDAASANIWAAAAGVGQNQNVPSGSYRTQGAGPWANANPGPPFTSINAAFAALNNADINGTWTLRFEDCAAADTGGVSSASLTLLPLLAGPASISGRVLNAYGAGIRVATITVTGPDLQTPLVVVPNTFGYFRVPNLTAGNSYVISVQARGYRFANSSYYVNLEQDLSEVNFVAEPR